MQSKVAIKSWISSLKLVRLGRDSSTAICCDYKEDEASGGVKARGARVNSVLHVKHKATWCFNL